MPVEIVMPRMSDTMEKGTIVRWLKREGEEVKRGEPIAEIETDKATMQLESYASGRIERILLPEGQSAPIGTPIAIVATEREARAEKAAAPPTAGAPPAPPPPPAPAAPPPAGPPARVLASPIARRLAEELGINLLTIKGTGPGGRITREDVEAAARARPAAAPAAPAVPVAPVAPVVSPAAAPVSRPLTRMQQTIARRMVQSKTTIPHFYVTTEVEMAAAAQLRTQLIEAWPEVRVSFSDLIMKAVGLALRLHPLVNAWWAGDHLEFHENVNVGYAVSTADGGLLVPVLHNVDKLDLRTLSRELKDLVQRTREEKSLPGDFEGGTFTISNLGQYPVEDFLAIINPPESGILAVGRIQKKPVVRDDQLTVSETVHLSLSGDHRVFYGVHAAEFLAEIKTLLERPLSLLA